jgi:hypothetical protein
LEQEKQKLDKNKSEKIKEKTEDQNIKNIIGI